MQSLLFGVSRWILRRISAHSPSSLAATALASYVPARRAAAIDPVETLKQE